MCVDKQAAQFFINLLLSSGAASKQTMNAEGSTEMLALMHTITLYYSPEECPDEVYMTVQ
jgi:hypothetical protein